jgi:hypothetical protein
MLLGDLGLSVSLGPTVIFCLFVVQFLFIFFLFVIITFNTSPFSHPVSPLYSAGNFIPPPPGRWGGGMFSNIYTPANAMDDVLSHRCYRYPVAQQSTRLWNFLVSKVFWCIPVIKVNLLETVRTWENYGNQSVDWLSILLFHHQAWLKKSAYQPYTTVLVDSNHSPGANPTKLF